MPNHFHFLGYSKPDVVPKAFSDDLKIMLSSYTRAINVQKKRSGSLFQQNTKVKSLDDAASTRGTTRSRATSTSQAANDYPFICFHYIHQNPMKAGLVDRIENWEMSSFRDYAGLREGTLCNKDLASQLLDIPLSPPLFLQQSYRVQIVNESLFSAF